jgi:hypothetical protein
MSKYDPLWSYIHKDNRQEILLSFEQIKGILTCPIDHSVLNYKKELLRYGYQVKEISLKEKTVLFSKVINKEQ